MLSWNAELEHWLEPFISALGHKARRRMCPAYIAGLIGPGDRKSVQPMAARDAIVNYDQLHHFINSGVWDAEPLEAMLVAEADKLVGGEDTWLIVDDTALPKKGCHSVGVAPQYASSLGKTANCQSLVSVTLASREVPVMVGLRLFLPEIWTDDRKRMARARVPKDRQVALTKPEIAIEEIDRIIACGARFGCVLANSGYGSSGPFRQALSERDLLWAVGLSRRQNVYPADVALTFPVAKTGRRRKYHIPDRSPVSAEAMLADEKWRKVSWRRGTKGRLSCFFSACRVRVADGHKHRMLDDRMQCMPGDGRAEAGGYRSCRGLCEQSHVRAGRSCRHSRLRQIRIDRHVEAWRSPFDTAQHQVLDGIEADGSARDGVAHRGSDFIGAECLHQPQNLHKLALALFAQPSGTRTGPHVSGALQILSGMHPTSLPSTNLGSAGSGQGSTGSPSHYP